jgi:putative tryptophan/tyrosine transport system substrate-binding protein
MTGHIGRREFISLLGAAVVAWPLAARAQQPKMPVIGFLGTESPESDPFRMAAFLKGLNETGYVEGRNVAFEYRWAHGQYHRLAALASDLVRLQVSVIAAIGLTPAALAAKVATPLIPIVFAVGGDPVRLGLVASLNRPSGNLTGVSFLVSMMAPKRLEILREAVPNAAVMGFLVNPNNVNLGSETSEMEGAAAVIGRKLLVVKAKVESDLETAFAELMQQRVGALCVEADQFFLSRRDRLVALAARHGLPTIYNAREYVVAGGLMSYGTPLADAHRLIGVYAGRVLKGEKPADLPVQQSVKVELVINMRSAKTLGLTFPITLLGRADEVIE